MNHDENEANEQPLVITEVRTQKRRETRRSIFVNGEFAFGVSEEIYVKYALYTGRVVTPEFIEEVLRQDELYRAKSYALRYLTRRMRSEQEIESKLKEKGFPPETVTETVRFLAEYNLIDDEEFARMFVNDQLLRRPVGRRRLDAELRRKGIGKESADRLLEARLTDDEELKNAMAAAEKKAPNIRKADPRKWEQSMANFLAGRGFGWGVVAKVIETFRQRRKDAGAATDEPEMGDDA